MKIFVHICCAPCYTYVRKRLEEQGYEVVGFFYNPNIHPFLEYRSRLESVLKYQELAEANIVYKDEYDLEKFLGGALSAGDRCEFCYNLRLKETAVCAKQKGYDAFTTTLLVSPTQKHELVKMIGEKIGKEKGIKFYYEDFRTGYEEGKRIASSLSLYRQRYCGCVFSERDRFWKKIIDN